MSEKWHQGRVIENRHWTEALFSLRVEAPRLGFEAGQFVRIALDIDGGRVARPFSFVNAPDDPVLEFYGIVVPEGPLSPRLARLAAGDGPHAATNPAGLLGPSREPPARGFGLRCHPTRKAPHLSTLRTETPWQRFQDVVLVHAVRHANELVYRALIEMRLKEKKKQLKYVTFVSREAHPGSLAGRIPAAVRDGRLERAAGIELSPQSSHARRRGTPDMLRDAGAALAERGMRKHRRRNPGHITVESFW